ncbi:hypothetical protein HK105_205053 [Polyrhizophydium stewartii]|uniref:Membrane magnesium transporter n=1 Tax=Polyrhizophydium stewartii TaxID=2732419 RepID=A0ABR4N7C0_9FUNG
MLGRVLYAAGLVLLAHAGYSAIEHFAYLKTIGKHDSHLPSDIIIELAVSLLLLIQGAVLVAGPLKPVSLQIELAKKSIELVDSTPGFKVVNHRGRSLFCAQ